MGVRTIDSAPKRPSLTRSLCEFRLHHGTLLSDSKRPGFPSKHYACCTASAVPVHCSGPRKPSFTVVALCSAIPGGRASSAVIRSPECFPANCFQIPVLEKIPKVLLHVISHLSIHLWSQILYVFSCPVSSSVRPNCSHPFETAPYILR